MLAGIGLVIIAGQLYAAAGLEAPASGLDKILGLPGAAVDVIGSAEAAASLAVGAGTIAVMVLWRTPRRGVVYETEDAFERPFGLFYRFLPEKPLGGTGSLRAGGGLIGPLLTAQITGAECAWSGLYDPRRLADAGARGPAVPETQAEVAGHFVGDRLKPAPPVDALPPGEGAVVRVDGHRVAVYRDEDGALHAVSPRCTHLGCLVGLNAAERLGVPLPRLPLRHRGQCRPGPGDQAAGAPGDLTPVVRPATARPGHPASPRKPTNTPDTFVR
ncbi:hypothetical protein SFUMM280S_10455 [Streptomyces fumanus]